jgi:hypothetical protein
MSDKKESPREERIWKPKDPGGTVEPPDLPAEETPQSDGPAEEKRDK